MCRDHPRSRGVYFFLFVWLCLVVGSSPLARGLRPRWRALRATCRIIPARAGFTRQCASPPPPPSDHPRSRGVYGVGAGRPVLGLGSSPLARGLLVRVLDHFGPRRIIPARAGFTYHIESRRFAGSGSSPLARGLRAHHWRLIVCSRIIPARAGFTPNSGSLSMFAGDHPRSRGVYKIKSLTDENTGGSSPLARGLLKPGSPTVQVFGIIPARAGFTRQGTRFRIRRWDHPRSRGVYRRAAE